MYRKLFLLISLFVVSFALCAKENDVEVMLKKIDAVSGVEKIEKATRCVVII